MFKRTTGEKRSSGQSKKLGLVLFALVFASIGGFVIYKSLAATGSATMYLQPATSTVSQSTDFTVQIRENSGTTTVNAVQANLTYPASQLDFVSIDSTTSAFTTTAQEIGAAGSITIARGNTTAISGDQLVAIVHFKSKTTPGDAVVSIATGSAVADSTTNLDILTTKTGGTYTVAGPPTVSITAPAANANVKGSIAVNANATDVIGMSNVQFKLDGVNLGTADTTSPYSTTWTTTTATDGPHSLTAVATNTSVLTTTSSAIAVNVDNTAPNTSITSNPATVTNATTASFGLAGTDNLTAAGSLSFQCKLDAGTYSACTTPKSLTGITAGSHTFSVQAVDAAGNVDATPATYTWSVDLTIPVSTITSTPPANTTATTANFSFTASETATFQCKISNTTTYLSYTSCTSGQAFTGLSVGAHTFTVQATDTAGNVEIPGTAQSYTWTIAAPDTTPPAVTMTAPTNGATVSGASVTVSATATDAVGVLGVQFYLDGTTAKLGAEDTTSPYGITWDTTTLANGTHTLTAIGRDAAGNLGTATAVTVTVNNVVLPPPDTTPPSTPANLKTTASTNTSISMAWDASTDPQGPNNQVVSGVATYSLYRSTSATGTYTLVTTTTSLQFTDGGLTGGTTYYYKVAATDNAGNLSPQSSSVTVKAPLTTVTLTANPATIPSGNATTLTWSSTDATSCTASGAWTGTLLTAGTQVTAVLSANTTYNLACTGAGGSASKSLTVVVNPPKIGDLSQPPDGIINAYDLSILLAHYATTSSTGDLNNDGIVNIYDLSILLTNYGK